MLTKIATNRRKQRHKMTTQITHFASTRRKQIKVFASTILLFILFAHSTCSAQQQSSQRLSSSISNILVNSNTNSASQPSRLPLVPAAAQNQAQIRQQQHPFRLSSDFDNVIESTPSVPAFASMLPQTSSPEILSTHLHSRSLVQAGGCQLPPTWMGRWYQANKEPIRVTNREISDKGLCRDRKGDKYLFEYVKNQQQPCLVCLVINERHLNVLQYKESSCQVVPTQFLNRTTNSLMIDEDHTLLDSICSDITGDAQLESLFRLDTPPIECPINGKYHFNYDNCREPQSSLDSCIDNKHLNFKYSACPDVPGSESKHEVLKCYADWSEGNNYYMIGRLEHASNAHDRGKFRCYVYEKSPDGEYIQMAQSVEESCYGLINANEGPKTLRLTARAPAGNRCQFPSYIQSQSDNWLSVDNSLIYMFNQNSTKYRVKETKEGNIIEEATCLQQYGSQANANLHPTQQHGFLARPSNQPVQHQAPANSASNANIKFPPSNQNQADLVSRSPAAVDDIVYLVQITKGCHTTEYCARFYKRTNGIVQIDYFVALPGSDNQRCRNAYTGTPQTQIITSTNLENQRCPFEGAYTIEAPLESDFSYNPSNIFICPRQSFFTAQCDHPSRLRIHYRCSPAKFSIKNLHCLGSWTSKGLVRLILSDDERQRYSAWYRDPAGVASTELTRSQHLVELALEQQQQQTNSFPQPIYAPIVDLQIALITPLPTISKPTTVRLTRRNQCAELRAFLNAPSFGSGLSSYTGSSVASSGISSAFSSSLIPGYQSTSAASSSRLATSVIAKSLVAHQILYSSMLLVAVSLLALAYDAGIHLIHRKNSVGIVQAQSRLVTN